jgi:hypothetical protein
MAFGEICQREPLDLRKRTSASAAAATSEQRDAAAASREPKTAKRLKRAYRAGIL